MLKKLSLAAAATLLMAGVASADPIEGKWKTAAGSNAMIAPCGDSFCITLTSGEHAGKQIGKMKAENGGSYSGTATDPADDKTYKGRASLNGNTLKMSGCILGGLICKTQSWTKF